MHLEKLYEPIKIGKLELKNRIVMLGIGGFLTENCRVSEKLKAFDGERARGGAGLIIRGPNPSVSSVVVTTFFTP